MTNAVIDNSTLTAVERVIGHIPLDRNYDLSGDLSAFEAYLSALLFYDRPVRIDDYKPEFSDIRHKHFPEIDAIKFESDSYEKLLEQSRLLTSEMFLRVKAGNLGDDILGQFLKDMELYVCPAWIMQSSDFLLKIRILADESGTDIAKYSPLMSAIFAQLSENKQTPIRTNWKNELISSDGKLVCEIAGDKGRSGYSIGGDIKAFSAGLNWLALRSVFYAIVSEHLEAVAICHPIRNDFQARFYTENIGTMSLDHRKAVLQYFGATSLDGINRSNEILGGSAFKLKVPLISAWACLKAGSAKGAREHILDVRYSPEAIALRARMRDIEGLIEVNNFDQARKSAATLFRDVQITIENLTRKYGSKDEDPFAIAANIVSLSGSFKLIPAIQKLGSLLPSRSKSVALLRNITLDLLQNPALGKVSNLLRSSALITSDEYQMVYSPKFEKPRFKNSSLGWKEPM